jgi:hypothetical protein
VFEKEKVFYETHKDEFHEKYLNKWLVIVGDSLFGAYDTPKEAIISATKRYKPGEFMMRLPANDGKVFRIGPFIRIRHA